MITFPTLYRKISRLYWVEADARIDKLQVHQVKELRKEKSGPILGDLYSQIESIYHDKLTRYSDLLRKTINYAYYKWKAVVRYIENGNWSIDNNEEEMRMKPVVLGRRIICTTVLIKESVMVRTCLN